MGQHREVAGVACCPQRQSVQRYDVGSRRSVNCQRGVEIAGEIC